MAQQLLEIDVGEPRVLADLLVGVGAQPLLGVLLQQAGDQVFSLLRYRHFRVIEKQWTIFDVVEHLLVVFVVKGRV